MKSLRPACEWGELWLRWMAAHGFCEDCPFCGSRQWDFADCSAADLIRARCRCGLVVHLAVSSDWERVRETEER